METIRLPTIDKVNEVYMVAGNKWPPIESRRLQRRSLGETSSSTRSRKGQLVIVDEERYISSTSATGKFIVVSPHDVYRGNEESDISFRRVSV
ncbi:hypothetical protein PUN28_011108 [Cardiocondyla obscurior]|uniref:Uncharacterized protein n=1 Tax=Cardiocondyla obscurior TaxID=286306 RepID=A0AAW2FLT9_9HYME